MSTVLYLVRHAATEANLARPPRLQGQHLDPPLAAVGVCQVRAVSGSFATLHLDHCYTSPLRRAFQTAELLAHPHNLKPRVLPELTECDVGRWEGMDWQTIRYLDADAYHRFRRQPSVHGYPGGENLADVLARAGPALDWLLERHAGEAVLVFTHQVVLRAYLAPLLGLPLDHARQLRFLNCGLSTVVRDEGEPPDVRVLGSDAHCETTCC